MITLYCPGPCKKDNPLNAKACSKCGKKFPTYGRKYRVRVKYKNHTVNRFTHSLDVARDIEKAISGDLARGKFDIYQADKEPTLDAVFNRYIEYAKTKKKSWPGDLSIYNRHIQPIFGSKKLSQILPLHIEKLKSDLRKEKNRNDKPYAPQTIKHVLIVIRRLYNMAVKWGMYKGLKPMDRVSMPKVDNELIRFLTEDQTTSLINAIDAYPDQEAADFIKLAMFTGLRRGEILKLKFDQVDFENDYIKLLAPKGGKSVSIPVSHEAIEILIRRKESDPERVNQFVFPGKSENSHRYDIKRPWKSICQTAGIEGFRFHDLRHNYASRLVSAGVALDVVKTLLTHKDIKTTLKYAHLSPGVVQEAARRSAGIIAGKNQNNVIAVEWGNGTST